MDSNPICHPSPAKKMKCSFLDYVQLLMIRRAGWLTRTPSATPLQPKKMKCSFLDYIQLLMIRRAGRWTWTPFATPLQPQKWNAHFWITFNSWWLAGLVDGHEPCVWPPWNAHFWIMFNFWWLAGLVDGLKPNLPPLSSQKNEMLVFGLQLLMIGQAGLSTTSAMIGWAGRKSQKNEMLIFGLRSTSDDWPGWSMDSNPICHPSPAKNMKCSF